MLLGVTREGHQSWTSCWYELCHYISVLSPSEAAHTVGMVTSRHGNALYTTVTLYGEISIDYNKVSHLQWARMSLNPTFWKHHPMSVAAKLKWMDISTFQIMVGNPREVGIGINWFQPTTPSRIWKWNVCPAELLVFSFLVSAIKSALMAVIDWLRLCNLAIWRNQLKVGGSSP